MVLCLLLLWKRGVIYEGFWFSFSQGCNRDLWLSQRVVVVSVLFTEMCCSGLMYSVIED